jgi:hypothetical protein
MENAYIDENYRKTLLAVDPTGQIRRLVVDPVTGGLKVNVTGASFLFAIGGPFPGPIIATDPNTGATPQNIPPVVVPGYTLSTGVGGVWEYNLEISADAGNLLAPGTDKGAFLTFSSLLDDAIVDGVINKAPSQNAVYDALFLKEDKANKGVANGYASLDATGKVPMSQLSISAFEYLGLWDALTNTPTLADGIGNNGDTYRVSVAGMQNLGSGIIDFQVGDYVIYNGTTTQWEKLDNTESVTSVFGRVGAIVALSGDYIASQITFTPAGTITAIEVQGALQQLDALKEPTLNKSTDATLGGLLTSDTLFPTQKATKTYIDNAIASIPPSTEFSNHFPDVVGTDVVLSGIPLVGSTEVYENGIRLSEGVTEDYTVSGATVTFNYSLINDDILVTYK